METKNVPILVKVISSLYYIFAVSSFLSGLLVLFLASLIKMGISAGNLSIWFVYFSSIIPFGMSILFFFVARGLGKTRPWARITVIILSGFWSILGIIFIVLSIYLGGIPLGPIASLFFNIAIGWYFLFNKSVKEVFEI